MFLTFAEKPVHSRNFLVSQTSTMKDYYYILGVSKAADGAQIRAAYLKLSVKFHPDKNQGDLFFEERFKDIQEAYSTLSDSIKRISYDAALQRSQSQGFEGNEAIRKQEERLRKEFEEALKRKEEEIRRKYQSPAERLAEEMEMLRRQKEAKVEEERIAEEKRLVKERERVLKEIDLKRRLLSEWMNEVESLAAKMKTLEADIRTGRQSIESLEKLLNSNEPYHARGGVKVFSFRSGEIESIKKELGKLKEISFEDDQLIFLRILLDFSRESSIESKHFSAYPHLVKMILDEKVGSKIFSEVYSRLKGAPELIAQFEVEVHKLFQ